MALVRELILATIDMIHQAKRRLASHIALDWRCATNPDPFAADAHSVRPNCAVFSRFPSPRRSHAADTVHNLYYRHR